MRRGLRLLLLLCLLGLLGLGSVGGGGLWTVWRARSVQAQTEPAHIACSCEKPVVSPGEEVGLTAWAGSSAGRMLQYTWAATAGTVTPSGSQARWDLRDVKPGTHRATVIVRDPVAGSADCSVRVVVRRQEVMRKSPGLESGWAFLFRRETEDESYGLYSYVLFGSSPSSETRDRYLKAIEAYLQLMPSIKSLEEVNIPRGELNVVYLPLDTVPTSAVSAPMILEIYDYARARALLRVLPGSRRDGPYLVSSLRPISPQGSGGRYLIQNLSSVPPHLAGLWMKEFLNQAAQERFWEERTADGLARKMRTTVGVFAQGLPEVVKGLDTLIAWAR